MENDKKRHVIKELLATPEGRLRLLLSMDIPLRCGGCDCDENGNKFYIFGGKRVPEAELEQYKAKVAQAAKDRSVKNYVTECKTLGLEQKEIKLCPVCKEPVWFVYEGGDAYARTSPAPPGTVTLSCRCSVSQKEWDEAEKKA